MSMIHVAAASYLSSASEAASKFHRVIVSTGIAGGHNHGNDPVCHMYIRYNNTLSIHYLEMVISQYGKNKHTTHGHFIAGTDHH